MIKEYITKSEVESARVASEFATRVPNGSIIALHGNLGAGKSVFARGFARGLGIEDSIPSPTFTIVQEYKYNTLSGENRWLFHMDLYRIADSNAALAFGIDEFIFDKNAIKLIEWSDRISDLILDSAIDVYINHIDEQSREIKIG